MKRKQWILPGLAVLLFLLTIGSAPLAAQARLMDLVTIEGVRENMIRGLGLVTGLNGTGDGSQLARQMAANLARRMGNNTLAGIPPDNLAVVMVTAKIPPFARPGAHIDVTVSSMGDAESLRGGTLIATYLMGFDSKTVYAIAEGHLLTGALAVSGQSGSREIINHPTVGRIPNGAMVEKGIPQRPIGEDGRIRLMMREASFATATNIATKINGKWPAAARAVDSRTIEVELPRRFQGNLPGFMTDIGQLRIPIVSQARVVISERNGTIVVGEDVVVMPVAITHSNLSISVNESFNVSQPEPFSQGETVVTPETDISIQERGTEMRMLPRTVSAGELARALNQLGLSPLDLITIFQMLKAQDALQAELIVL